MCLICHIFIDLLGVDNKGPQGLMLLWPFSDIFFYPSLDLYPSIFNMHGNVVPLKSLIIVIISELGITCLIGLPFFILAMISKKIKCSSLYLKR